MSRRRRGDPVHGVVLLDKPVGLSSNQALQRVRRLFNAQKAGHTGTLDPFATGLLPVCLGEATKTTAFLLDAVKAYRAEAMLGEATSTGDLVTLRRLRVGPFTGDAMVSLETLEADAEAGRLAAHLLPVDAGLPDWPAVRLAPSAAASFRNGNPAALEATGGTPPEGWVRVQDGQGVALGLGEIDGGVVQPRRVFQLGA